MQIHWFTVVAQIVNFLLLVFLLKRFLYKPVLEVMERRKKHIAASILEADTKVLVADKQIREYQEKTLELESNRQRMMQEMREEVQHEREKLLSSMRSDAEKSASRWREEISREKNDFIGDLRRRLVKGTASAVRHILADMADSELQERIVAVFLRRFAECTLDDRNRLLDHTVQLQSSFNLTQEQQLILTNAVLAGASKSVDIDFVPNPALVCGIALVSPGYTLSWSMASYLDDLQAQILVWFENTADPGVKGKHEHVA